MGFVKRSNVEVSVLSGWPSTQAAGLPWPHPLGSSEKEQLNPDQQCEVSIPSLPRAEI